MMSEWVRRTRTVRRFQEERQIDSALLRQWIDLARLGGSARNGQVLKYMVITEDGLRRQLFPLLGWAGYLRDWPGPAPGERPPAYVACLLDTVLLRGPETEAHFDLGIATQNLLLGAAECGVFGCRIGSFSSSAVHHLLQLTDRFKVLLVLALGYPAETIALEELGPEGDIRYWHDEQGVHHVPKRRLTEILIEPPVVA
jgi:nitroreductase